mgnify:CR=1 FL=1
MKTSSDIFNFDRFSKLFVSDLKSCTSNFGLSFITLSAIIPLATYIICILFNLTFNDGTWQAPGIIFRTFLFVFIMVCIFIFMPVKCYGRLTEKNYGSFYLLIPASTLEKFLSMIILCAVVSPLVACSIFFLVDSILCLVDSTCGESVLYLISHAAEGIMDFIYNLDLEENSHLLKFAHIVSSPWLYLDDIFGASLPFLLGALIFKRNKTAKTILSLIGISIILSILSAPLTNNLFETSFENVDIFETDIFSNMPLIDTISDTIMNLLILTAIYFKLKSLKH